MDTWLKGLVATACVVIIAGGAYFAFAQWRQYSEVSAAAVAADAETRERSLQDLYQLADADENEKEKIIAYCNDLRAGHQIITPPEASARIDAACRSLGI